MYGGAGRHCGAEPDEPHWHLGAVGVRPETQGRGVGNALLATFIERVETDARAAYLETSHQELTAWYARFGFRQRGRLLLPGGVRAWTMWRSATHVRHDPAPASSRAPADEPR